MADPAANPFDTPALQDYLDRWQAGDREAANEMLRGIEDRLRRLARRMCRGFPNVRGFADSGDVLQGSLIRLLRTLQTIRPATTRDFFNLAAVHVRRELLDLARHYRGRSRVPIQSPAASPEEEPRAGAGEPASPVPDDFDLWSRFHEAVGQLPVEEREVVGLVFYHGWTQTRIADLFSVDERTIRRRWAAACTRLRKMVGGVMPGE